MSKSVHLSFFCLAILSGPGLSGCMAPARTMGATEMPIRLPDTDSLRVHSPWRFMKAIQPEAYSVNRTRLPITIDGIPDDPAWAEASFSNDFVDIEGGVRPDPAQRTRFKMLWDSTYLYIAGFVEETDLWATITKTNEVIFYDNDFEVFLDPDGDHHNYHELELNALNTRWELTLRRPYRDGGPYFDPDNVGGLLSAVHLNGTLNDASDTDVSWTVEIAMTWDRLRQFDAPHLPPHRDDRWRINFSRVQWDLESTDTGYRKVTGHKEHNWVWSPIGIIDMHRPERWGWIQFADEDSTRAIDNRRTSIPPLSEDSSYLPIPDEMRIRDRLMEIYYLAEAFRSRTGRYPNRLEDLFASDSDLSTNFSLIPSRLGYIVRYSITEARKPYWIILNQRGRIWKTKANDLSPQRHIP